MDIPEYAIPSESFRNAIQKLPKSYSYLIVFHLSRNNLPYLLEWVKNVPILGVISIPYSEQQEVKKQVEQHTQVYSPKLNEISDCIIEICSKNIEKDVVLVEIGGYAAEISRLLPNVTLAVEDTTRGHERYREYESSLAFPVVSIARTKGKQKEDDPVGRAVAISALNAYGRLENPQKPPNIAVLGYGGVGRAAAKYSRESGAAVTVYDPSQARMSLAKEDGFAPTDRQSLLGDADIIIGCSGHQSIQIEDIDTIKQNVLLVSGSSKQVEFPYHRIQELALNSVQDGIIETLTIHNKTFNIAYAGQPINFYFDISLGDIFDVPMTLLAESVSFGTTQALTPGLHELPA